MISKYTNKNGVKLLATVMVFAIALAGAIVIFGSDDYNAEETKTYTDIEGATFKDLKKDGNGYIVLDKNYNLKSSIALDTASSSLKIDLNGFEIKGNLDDLIYVTADNCTIEIKDSKGTGSMVNEITPSDYAYGSIVNAAYVYLNKTEYLPDKVSLTVNGGTYKGDRLFIVGSGNDNDGNESTTSFQNAKMYSTEYALWLSFGSHYSSTIENCEITAKYGGIYFATVKNATLSNTTVISDETGVEIKSGTIAINSCSITSKAYVDNESIGYSQSGGAVSAIVINNAYASTPISVTIDGSKVDNKASVITNTASASKPVIITDDSVYIEYNNDGTVKATNVRGTQNISFTWTDHDSDVKVEYRPNTAKNLTTESKTDDQVLKGYITVNSKAYIPDIQRLTEAISVENKVLNTDLIIDVVSAITDLKNIELNGYKLSIKSTDGTAVSGKIIGAPDKDTKSENSATFASYKIGTTTLKLSSGSIILEDGSTAASTGGTITITGNAKVVGDTTVGDIILAAGATLSIPADTTLVATTITSSFLDPETETKPVVKVEGTLDTTVTAAQANKLQIQVSTGATIEGSVDESTMAYDGQGKFEFGDTLNSDYTVTKEEYLSSDLIIPAGVTLTIATGGDLNLAKNNILVLGSLIIETGASVSATSGSETIYLVRNCEFSNDGYIGVGGQEVTISANTETIKTEYTSVTGINYKATGSVSLLQANGAEFSIVKDGSNYVLAVTGDIYTDAADATITISGAVINGSFTVGENVDAIISGSVKVIANGVVTVDGYMAPAAAGTNKVILVNKATFIANGIVDNLKVEAQTGDYQTSVGYATGVSGTKITTVTFPDFDPEADATAGIKGIILTVGTYNYIKTESDGSTTAMTSQRLYISGDLKYATVKENENYSNPIETGFGIANNSPYVADDSILTISKKMIFDTIKMNIIVEGQIIAEDTNVVPTGITFVGTSYSITTTSTPKVSTFYIEPFTDAISKIDTVDKKTLTIQDSKVKISDALTLTEGQVLAIGNDTVFTIESTGVLTVNAKAKITGTIYSVEGILKIMTGGSCANAPTKYASYVKGTDSIQYSGILVALNNAAPGDIITINNETSISTGDLVIKEGVTVNASKNITVADGNADIAGKLVLTDGAKLIVSGTKKNIDVTGEVNAIDGDVSISSGRFTSEGKTTLSGTTALDFDNVDSFYYVDEDSNKVLTSAQAAIDAAAAQDPKKTVYVAGTVSVSNLNVKTDLIVEDGSKVNLGDVTLASGKKITLTGKTTGTFSAQTGIEESTTGALVTSVIKTVDAYGITIGAGSITDSMNVKTKTMYIYGALSGKATVIDGTVTVGNGSDSKLTVNQNSGVDAYLTVSKDAALEVAKGMTLEAGYNALTSGKVAAVVIDGTLDVKKDGTVTIPTTDTNGYSILAVNGTLAIGDDAGVAYNGTMNVDGKIIVSETASKEGLLTVNNTIFATENASIAGPVKISSGKYIQALAGADLSGAKINVDATGTSAAFPTTFYINNEAYATVYTIDGVSISTIFTGIEFSVDGLDLTGIETITDGKYNWYTSADYTDKIASSATTDKDFPGLYYNAPKAEVIGTISTGVGLQIYLNGISVENYKVTGGYKLPVGTYKVNIENLVGYDKTNAVISFNGATVADGGSITISEKDFVLTATGATPSVTPTPEPTPIQPSEKDDSMGITEYLLIVLVILAAILVVVVAIRMMRS